jgi:outer membrane lipopolysaccharide assembly protein LptE/RlpB
MGVFLPGCDWQISGKEIPAKLPALDLERPNKGIDGSKP